MRGLRTAAERWRPIETYEAPTGHPPLAIRPSVVPPETHHDRLAAPGQLQTMPPSRSLRTAPSPARARGPCAPRPAAGASLRPATTPGPPRRPVPSFPPSSALLRGTRCEYRVSTADDPRRSPYQPWAASLTKLPPACIGFGYTRCWRASRRRSEYWGRPQAASASESVLRHLSSVLWCLPPVLPEAMASVAAPAPTCRRSRARNAVAGGLFSGGEMGSAGGGALGVSRDLPGHNQRHCAGRRDLRHFRSPRPQGRTESEPRCGRWRGQDEWDALQYGEAWGTAKEMARGATDENRFPGAGRGAGDVGERTTLRAPGNVALGPWGCAGAPPRLINAATPGGGLSSVARCPLAAGGFPERIPPPQRSGLRSQAGWAPRAVDKPLGARGRGRRPHQSGSRASKSPAPGQRCNIGSMADTAASARKQLHSSVEQMRA